uniref:Uncharacterized protein n=1 Tax=Trypanosoma congolense (strain IL3000) TaxID=1068625 RepID=G0V013_TRYCI|nr:conserved hypothetical protein [Trypanosoma congolense IL3000]
MLGSRRLVGSLPADVSRSSLFQHAKQLLHGQPSADTFIAAGGDVGAQQKLGQKSNANVGATRVFLRRNHRANEASRESPEVRGTFTDGGNDGGNGGSVSGDLRAYEDWSRKVGACSADEFLHGVKHSYRCLGVLVETLSEAVWQKAPVGKSMAREAALAKLQTLLSKEYGVREDALGKVGLTHEDTQRNFPSACKEVSQTLMTVLPLSEGLAEFLYTTWEKHRTFDYNLMCIAAPNDYIIKADIAQFYAYTADEGATAPVQPADVEAAPSPSEAAVGTVNAAASEQGNPNRDTATGTTDVNKEGPAPQTPAGSTPAGNACKGSKKSENAIRTLSQKGIKLKPIPASAPAVVLATIDVVTPPQRYFPSFDWFYQRIIGHANEYERIEAARVCAGSSAGGVLVFMDFIKRMFTGRSIEFDCTHAATKLHGATLNIGNCPPAIRKLLCFYLDGDNRWVLFDVLTVDRVLTPMTGGAFTK